MGEGAYKLVPAAGLFFVCCCVFVLVLLTAHGGDGVSDFSHSGHKQRVGFWVPCCLTLHALYVSSLRALHHSHCLFAVCRHHSCAVCLSLAGSDSFTHCLYARRGRPQQT